MEATLIAHMGQTGFRKLETYLQAGGYRAVEKAFALQPHELIDIVRKSEIRGRGGAGFSAGMKWGFVPKESSSPKYLCCNADESEPGTFKDRQIVEYEPFLLLEGITICSYAVGIHTAYIYIRGEFSFGAQVLEDAIAHAYAKNLLGKNILGKGFGLDVFVHRGAGAYICGEETALLESVEGERGQPRLKPPFPALVGLFKGPTVINNVETLAALPSIVLNGAEWYASIGPSRNKGTKLFSVSGHVARPGVYELPLGTNLMSLINDSCGGIRGGRKLKAVIPGGASAPVLRADECNVSLDFDSLAKISSMLGSGGAIVMDDTTCMVKVAHTTAKFFYEESCGKCTPCREGIGWLEKLLRRLECGEGKETDLALISDLCDNIKGKTVCPFGDAFAYPLEAFIRKFADEFLEHVRLKRCPFGNQPPEPVH